MEKGILSAVLVLALAGCAGTVARASGLEPHGGVERHGNWAVLWITDKFTDERNLFARVLAEAPRCSGGEEGQGLMLLCDSGFVQVQWQTGCYMGRKGSTSRFDIRVGAGKAWSEPWAAGVAGGGWATPAPELDLVNQMREADSLKSAKRKFRQLEKGGVLQLRKEANSRLLSRMEKADIPRLLIRGGGRDAEFDITGIRKVAPIMVKACGGR